MHDQNFIRGITCICRDTGMCYYFGYFLGGVSGFFGTSLGYFQIFEHHFLVKFDFLGIIQILVY